jgi:hypothetical protein
MAMEKITVTLDAATVAMINDAAARLSLPKSRIVRDAVREFHGSIDELSRAEKKEMLDALSLYLPQIATRSRAATERELREIRESRRRGGRRSPSKPA